MASESTAEQALTALARRGFAKARVVLSETDHHELSAEFGHLSLLRTNHNATLSLAGIVDDKQGSISINKCTPHDVERAVDDLWEVARGSRPDPANDIAEAQPRATFARGPAQPDRNAMFDRLAEVLDHASTKYPTLKVGQSTLSYYDRRSRFLNSNGVDFTTRRGSYGASLMFTAKDGADVSSFNYTGFALEKLDKPLANCGTTDELLRQTTEQVRTQRIPEKFVGELLITPDCLEDFLSFLLQSVSDVPLISGTSLYKGKVGAPVAAEALTVTSRPTDLIGGHFLTGDGYVAENTPLIERGVLKSYLLSLYGARKTGLPRARTGGGCLVVDGGQRSRDAMLRDVKRGVLITRFSGGRPNDKGDFSGVAKNSYYIENGVVRYPIAETMVSGNMAKLLENVVEVSRERAEFGYATLPWMRVREIGIS